MEIVAGLMTFVAERCKKYQMYDLGSRAWWFEFQERKRGSSTEAVIVLVGPGSALPDSQEAAAHFVSEQLRVEPELDELGMFALSLATATQREFMVELFMTSDAVVPGGWILRYAEKMRKGREGRER